MLYEIVHYDFDLDRNSWDQDPDQSSVDYVVNDTDENVEILVNKLNMKNSRLHYPNEKSEDYEEARNGNYYFYRSLKIDSIEEIERREKL